MQCLFIYPKIIHHDLNTYVSTIVDLSIAYYYNHIVNEGDNQQLL